MSLDAFRIGLRSTNGDALVPQDGTYLGLIKVILFKVLTQNTERYRFSRSLVADQVTAKSASLIVYSLLQIGLDMSSPVLSYIR